MRASLAVALLVAACSGTSRPATGREPALAAPDAGVVARPPTGGPPVARVDEVRETIHGVEVVDPYRWMEAEGDELTAYLAAQDAYARAALAALPDRDALGKELDAADRGVTSVFVSDVRVGPRIFTWHQAPDDAVATYHWREGWDGKDAVLVDPRTLDTGDVHHAIDFAVPCPRGKYVAYGISASGSEDSVIRVIEVDTGKVLDTRIDRAQYASISWRPDGVSFFYWRRAAPAEGAAADTFFDNSAAYLYELADGAAIDETPVFGPQVADTGLTSKHFPFVEVTPNSAWALGYATRGTSADLEVFVARLASVVPGKTTWRRITDDDDGVSQVVVHKNDVYLLSHAGAPRRQVLRVAAAKGTLATATVFVAEGDAVLQSMTAAKDGLYLVWLDRGLSKLERVSWDGKRRAPIALPHDGTISGLGGRADVDGVTFELDAWTRAPTAYHVTPKRGVVELRLREPWPVDYRDLVSEEVEATSADGTKVPLSIIRRADHARDGRTPALLDAYAAYGISNLPAFRPDNVTLVRRGAVFAVCHARGGGELGKAWHTAGTKLNKERGVEDLVACAEHLIAGGYTTASRLGVTGTSAGGAIAGGAITARPELFAAALLRVPFVNLVRGEQMAGGPANVPEFGSMAVADEARALIASDPYLRVKDGVAYPAVILTTGLHDIRLPSWQPAKLAARLQAASSSGKPVLLRVERDAGHGHGSTRAQAIAERADLFAFLLAASSP